MRKAVLLPSVVGRSFQRQCRPSLRTRVRKSRQLVKRLRSCCSLPPSRDVMLYLSRSNISCFAFHATLHNHKTLSVTKYMYTRKIIFYFNEIPYSSSFSPPPFEINRQFQIFALSVIHTSKIQIDEQTHFTTSQLLKKKENPNIYPVIVHRIYIYLLVFSNFFSKIKIQIFWSL